MPPDRPTEERIKQRNDGPERQDRAGHGLDERCDGRIAGGSIVTMSVATGLMCLRIKSLSLCGDGLCRATLGRASLYGNLGFA
jgi:hypothetical protein